MGANKEFYGVGFSLGANHLTRYLGAANPETNMLKAAVSVSNPFDVLASSIAIRDSSLGIVDYVMRVSLIKQFVEGNYKHNEYGTEWAEKVKQIKSIMEFDNFVRSKILGYKSVHSLYRNSSCDRFIGNISVPLLLLASRDDPCTPIDRIPISDLYENPNCYMLFTRYGGHCDFLTYNSQG